MKEMVKPMRDSRFVLRKINDEFQLHNTSNDTVVYINESAAVIWQLCDGSMNVIDIKTLLKDCYPGAAEEIDKDVDEMLDMLWRHEALCGL